MTALEGRAGAIGGGEEFQEAMHRKEICSGTPPAAAAENVTEIYFNARLNDANWVTCPPFF
jgi:hypothetical protein